MSISSNRLMTIGANEVNKQAKSAAILRELINVHPFFASMTKNQRKWVLNSPSAFNVERLFEETLEYFGNYRFTNNHHSDFSDRSEAKTASVQLKAHKKSYNSHKGCITNIGSVSGNLKSGALRVCIYIAPRDEIQYYYIPKRHWSKMTLSKSQKGDLYLSFTYNNTTNCIPKLIPYRVLNIKALAKSCN